MPEDQIPIQPVENPILCSPYKEPDMHWLYDTKSGIPPKTPGRRPASYWFKTERTGGAQRDLFAEEERDDLPLVDAIESGITKIPRLPAIDNTGRPDPKYFKLWDHITRDLKPGDKLTGGKPKPAVVYRKAEDALLTLAGEWKQKLEQVTSSAPGQDRTPPVMIVVCDNTDIAKEFYRAISGEELIDAEVPDEDEDDDETPRRKKKKEKAKKHYSAGLSGFPEL